MSMPSLKFIIFLSSLFLLRAHALYIEPNIGYMPNGTLETDQGEISQQGIQFGGKLGIGLGPFALGGDIQALQAKGSQNQMSFDFETLDYGTFASLHLAEVLSFWFTYVLHSNTRISPALSSQVTEFSGGSGIRTGIGYYLLPHLLLNIEFRSVRYKDSRSGETPLTPMPSEKKASGTFINLSFPLSF